jgi:hypothetical protein
MITSFQNPKQRGVGFQKILLDPSSSEGEERLEVRKRPIPTDEVIIVSDDETYETTRSLFYHLIFVTATSSITTTPAPAAVNPQLTAMQQQLAAVKKFIRDGQETTAALLDFLVQQKVTIRSDVETFFVDGEITKLNFFLMGEQHFKTLPVGVSALLCHIISLGSPSPFKGGQTDSRKVFLPIVMAQKELGFVENVAKALPVPAADQLEKKVIEERQKRTKKIKTTSGTFILL